MAGIRSDLGHFVVDNAVTGLVAAVIIGNSGNTAIESLLKNIVMPIVYKLTGFSEEQWKKESMTLFGIELKIRTFLADTFSFFITVFITFIFLRYFAIPLIAGSKYKPE